MFKLILISDDYYCEDENVTLIKNIQRGVSSVGIDLKKYISSQ